MSKYILPWEFDKNKMHEYRCILGQPLVEAAVVQDRSLMPDYPAYYRVKIYTTMKDYNAHRGITFETREAAKDHVDAFLIKHGYVLLPEHLLVLK